MANPWFRLYAEIVNDPKVLVVTEALRWRYVALLCIHCNEQYENAPDDEVALSLRVTVDEWLETKKIFIERKLLDADGKIRGWEKRQYISDLKDPTAAERQKRYRDKNRNDRNATVTSRLPESDTDTDTDKEKIQKKKRDLQSLPDFLESCKAEGIKPVPDDDPVFDYARKTRIPLEFLELQWLEFKENYSDGEKRYKDWRKVFRNSVRGNWHKIWYIDANGNYVLTTAGMQAKNAHRRAA